MKSLEQIQSIVHENKLVFLSLSKQDCKICGSLKPKVERALEPYSNLKIGYVDLERIPEAIKEYGILNLPTIILYAMGKEVYRVDRSHNIEDLKDQIEKYNRILFE